MNSIGVGAVLAALLLLITTVKGDAGVSFWQTEFTMTCPDTGTWYKGKTPIGVKKEKLTLKYDESNKSLYNCKYNDEKTTYHFYVKGRVCANCFELDGITVVVAVVADVLVTGGVILLVYTWAKRRISAGPTRTNKVPPHAAGRAGPPVPSPDYEQLNAHTRSPDTYSAVNRMG